MIFSIMSKSSVSARFSLIRAILSSAGIGAMVGRFYRGRMEERGGGARFTDSTAQLASNKSLGQRVGGSSSEGGILKVRNGSGYDYLQKSRGESIEMRPANNFQDGGAALGQGSPAPTTVPAERTIHHVAAGWVGRLAVDFKL